MTREFAIGNVKIGGGNPLVLVAGPCVIEDEKALLRVASILREICAKADFPLIFKSSFDKANRTSIRSFRGPGMERGLRILERVKEELNLPVLSDVHEASQVKEASEVLDVLQIPAFLCRQTDLLLEAGKTGKPVNVKKGQFLSPWEAQYVLEKVASTGNHQVILTERGTCFGYNNLVVDMRSLPIMRGFGYPVLFDASHSVQLPGGASSSSSGLREFVPHLVRAAAATGCDGLYMEVHEDPDSALCDGPNMLRLKDLPVLLDQVKRINAIVKGSGYNP